MKSSLFWLPLFWKVFTFHSNCTWCVLEFYIYPEYIRLQLVKNERRKKKNILVGIEASVKVRAAQMGYVWFRCCYWTFDKAREKVQWSANANTHWFSCLAWLIGNVSVNAIYVGASLCRYSYIYDMRVVVFFSDPSKFSYLFCLTNCRNSWAYHSKVMNEQHEDKK